MWWPRAFLFVSCAMILSAFDFCANAAAPVNPRATDNAVSSGRAVSDDVVARHAKNNVRSRSAVTQRSGESIGRAATNGVTARSAVPEKARSAARGVSVSRAAKNGAGVVNARTGRVIGSVIGGLSRSATTARATAVFNDVNKIGSGYATCRESYATCMDQLCANANESYRRCFCSSRYDQFRKTEDLLDRAMIMLEQFQDTNLEMVDKTAAEVNAMYSATVGEAAIKKDTSASAKALQEINNLLSGKSNSTKSTSTNSLGVLSFDFNTDLDDIWSDAGGSIFSGDGQQDISTLEGVALFNAAQKQCVRLSQSNCENDAVFSMAKSSYNIFITQDCNIYEKNLNTKREKVAQAVRLAEKYLREARLEEYRTHNSADVNQCITAVRSAILQDTACGADYKRCLDPTGAYIDAKGEPIYSPRLLKLEETISLDGEMGSDILNQNQNFSKFLDGYRKYVTRELDTCRDISEFVWTEFKRNAIIEIAQAQTEKIEEVKASCVDTVAECYDSVSKTLVNMDKNTATTAGALGRYASRDMCREKVISCANLYNTSSKNCQFDSRGHLTSMDEYSCGLASLLNYVDAVDTISVVEKCATAINEYLVNLCTPDDGKYSYPYNCKGMKPEDISEDNNSLPYVIRRFAENNCYDSTSSLAGSKYANGVGGVNNEIDTRVDTIISGVLAGVRESLREVCESTGGMWYSNTGFSSDKSFLPEDKKGDDAMWTLFYNTVSGRGVNDSDLLKWGACIENDEMTMCLEFNDGYTTDIATWDSSTEQCTFTDAWYKMRCEGFLGGEYDGNYCYVPDSRVSDSEK